MTLRLKAVLAEIRMTQAALAGAVGVSPATMAQIINHDHWPRHMERKVLERAIRAALGEQGAQRGQLQKVFEKLVQRGCHPAGPDINRGKATHDGDDIMLLRKQTLTPEARRAFGLVRDPFADPQSADDVFTSPDIRYVRESLYQVARHGGFLAVVGESGAGKSTLRKDLIERLQRDHQPVIVIEPYVLGLEANDVKGKTLKAAHIAEAILAAVAPRESVRRSPEARFRQLHHALRESARAGNGHVLIIEEAHSLPIPTLKHLKRFYELEDGFRKLLGIVLLGQSELALTLSETSAEVREVVQRCEIVLLHPLDAHLPAYLRHRFDRVGRPLAEVMEDAAVDALRDKLGGSSRRPGTSVLYPLAVHNVVIASINAAAEYGVPRVTADVVREV